MMGSKLSELRKSAGLTQQALANKSGVNIRQIQKIEKGESAIKNVTLGNATALANALGIADLRDLLK